MTAQQYLVVVADGEFIRVPAVTSRVRSYPAPGRRLRLAPSSLEEGTAAHEAIAAALAGQTVEAPYGPYVAASREFLEVAGLTPLAVEAPAFRRGAYGGVVDCVARDADGRGWLVDWKTGTADGRTALQLMAYAHAGEMLWVEGAAELVAGDDTIHVPAGRAVACAPSAFVGVWAVLLTRHGAWQAVGFDPQRPSAPLHDAHAALFEDVSPPLGGPVDLSVWWQWQCAPLAPDQPTTSRRRPQNGP